MGTGIQSSASRSRKVHPDESDWRDSAILNGNRIVKSCFGTNSYLIERGEAYR